MKINVSKMDRKVAVLVYKSKIYEDDNHQYALEIALLEDNKSLGFELNDDFDVDKASEITYNMSKNNEIYTFDVYSDGKCSIYLISHFKSNLEACYELIKDYAQKHNYIIGSFGDNFNNYECEVYI